MIVDLQAGAPDLLNGMFDVCIVGGGVAGITLALKLSSYGRRVALIEAGGRTVSEASQNFYRGENTGTENLPLHETRLRALGGSSNHWGGWCRPFDAHDFQRKEFAPDGSWPISGDDLRPYLDEAAAVLGVNRYAGADLDLKDGGGRLRTARMYFSTPPARLGERYYDRMEQDRRLVVALNAPLVGMQLDHERQSVTAVSIGRPAPLETLSCRARYFVLAQGTVENVRSLLLLNRANGNRPGNASGLVGRYYLQHLHQKLGQFVRLQPDAQTQAADARLDRAFFLSTEKALARTRVGAFRLYSSEIDCAALADELRQIVVAAVCSRVRDGGDLFVTAEHLPNAESRIVLVDAKDPLGRPRVRLDWRISDDDRLTLRVAGTEFGRYLIGAGLGRLRINPDVLEGTLPLKGWTALPSAAGAAGHQMGGARMGRSPQDGVVDANCRVWGTSNLHVAGAAVFRTCSQVTPTLTIVQLGLRLADHLHRSMDRP